MILKIGSRGEKVKELQRKLGIKDDGAFGPMTDAKVKEWQSRNGLAPNGVVDTKTWDFLFSHLSDSGFKLLALRGHIPDSVIEQIPSTAKAFNISTSLRLAHFLAQCAHESGNFRAVSENLNYSIGRMVQIFRSDFDTNKDGIVSESEMIKARSIVGNPVAIGNFVYANQNGNGPESSGDGYKYRGRGYIQLTGRGNYVRFDRFVNDNIIENPDLVATKYPLMSAAFFFNSNNLWRICDRGATDSVVKALTLRVNGGYNGLEDRIGKFKLFHRILN